MSGWDAYITSLLGQSSSIKRAAIIGLDGTIWARTEGDKLFDASEAELSKFAGLFKDLSSVPTVGADLEGVHYIVPLTEGNLIFGKKDKTGFVAQKTNSAILVGVFEGDSAAGTDARGAVEKLSGYLVDSGY